jgi:hypothetical protein
VGIIHVQSAFLGNAKRKVAPSWTRPSAQTRPP